MTNELAGGINTEADIDEGDLKNDDKEKTKKTVTTCSEQLEPK